MASEPNAAAAPQEDLGGAGRADAGPSAEPPLCVDLDGTLIATDSLWEAILLLVKARPLDLLKFPGWIAGGKARFKEEVFRRATVDAVHLPYRADVLEFLEAEKRAGRRLVLATGSHRTMADAVADHLRIFDEVAATEGANNLSGEGKLAELRRRFGDRFDYIGDSHADLCLWKAARRAYLVSPGPRLARSAAQICTPCRIFNSGGAASAALNAMRPHQWIKNLLVLLPLIFAHQIQDRSRVTAALLAFVAFCACASCFYILNDLLDLEADRRHASKRHRPFASGKLSVPAGLLLSAALLVTAFAIAAVLPLKFQALLAAYAILTTLYSFWLKRKLLVDIILLASLYTHRIIAGAAAIDVPLTIWLLAFSMFFFLSLAFAKRYSELLGVEEAGGEQIRGREYKVTDLRIIESVGPASGYLSVLVFCNYLDSPLVKTLYPRPNVLWLMAPLLLYWITRIWFLARRRLLHDDPIVFAMRDRVSRLAGLIAALILIAAWAPKPAGGWPF